MLPIGQRLAAGLELFRWVRNTPLSVIELQPQRRKLQRIVLGRKVERRAFSSEFEDQGAAGIHRHGSGAPRLPHVPPPPVLKERVRSGELGRSRKGFLEDGRHGNPHGPQDRSAHKKVSRWFHVDPIAGGMKIRSPSALCGP